MRSAFEDARQKKCRGQPKESERARERESERADRDDVPNCSVLIALEELHVREGRSATCKTASGAAVEQALEPRLRVRVHQQLIVRLKLRDELIRVFRIQRRCEVDEAALAARACAAEQHVGRRRCHGSRALSRETAAAKQRGHGGAAYHRGERNDAQPHLDQRVYGAIPANVIKRSRGVKSREESEDTRAVWK